MPTSNPQKVEEIVEVLDKLHDEGIITDWEFEFMESIKTRGAGLSDKQIDVLDRIYEKVCKSNI